MIEDVGVRPCTFLNLFEPRVRDLWEEDETQGFCLFQIRFVETDVLTTLDPPRSRYAH